MSNNEIGHLSALPDIISLQKQSTCPLESVINLKMVSRQNGGVLEEDLRSKMAEQGFNFVQVQASGADSGHHSVVDQVIAIFASFQGILFVVERGDIQIQIAEE